METNIKRTQTANPVQGFFAEPRIFLSKDGNYLLHALPGNMLIRRRVNYYLKVLKAVRLESPVTTEREST